VHASTYTLLTCAHVLQSNFVTFQQLELHSLLCAQQLILQQQVTVMQTQVGKWRSAGKRVSE
jgi:hypothetical protein